jgi:lipopolysaccharide export system permease protein
VFGTLDRYILRTVAKPLAVALAIGLSMLLAERLVRVLDTTLGKKNSFSVVLEILAYLVPHYLGTAIPAALILGLLFGFGRLSKDSEIDAALAGGIGLHRLTLPVMQISVLLSLLALFVFGWAQPYARYAYRAVVYDLKNVQVFYLAEEGVFMQSGSRTFILDKLERSKNAFERIFVYDDNGPKGSETVTASDGVLIPQPGDARPVLRLNNGHRLKLAAEADPASPAPLPDPETAEFATLDTPLGQVTKSFARARGEDERELTLPELAASLDAPPKGVTVAEMTGEFHKRLVYIATILILPLFAIPFAVGSRRSKRAYATAIALVVIIAFHEIIEQGALVARAGNASPYVAIWLPWALLTGFALWRFGRVAFRLKHDGLQDAADRLGDAGAWIGRKLFKRGAEAGP